MSRESGIVPSHLVEEALGVLAADQDFYRITERMIEAAALVVDDLDDHRGGDVTAPSFVA